MQAQFTEAPEHWVYWDRFAERMGNELQIKLPRPNESWSKEFTRLRRAVATERSPLGRFLRDFEARLYQENSSPDESVQYKTARS
jgi:hypothetical protein